MADGADRDIEDAVIVELATYVPTPAPAAPREMAFREDAWLPDEDARLRALFAADAAIAEIAETLGRTFHGARTRIGLLGLRRNSARPWTDMEDAEVVARYRIDRTAALAQDLGRTVGAVYARAQLLGLSDAACADWDPWEDAQLRAGYAADLPVAKIAVIVARTPIAVNSRAYKLGLRHPSTPPGWTAPEIARALALAEEGHRYRAILDLLAAEGFPRRTKLGLNPVLHRLGYGRGWGRRWTPEEDDLLRQAYARGDGLTALSKRLGRASGSLRWRAEALGLRGTHPRRDGFRAGPAWTPEEDARLRDLYGKVSTRRLAAELGRPLGGVLQHARQLGLKHGYLKPFTPEEDRAVAVAWRAGLSLRDVATASGRDVAVVHRHAKRLGLAFGDPARPAPASRGRVKDRPTWTLAQILALEKDPAA